MSQTKAQLVSGTTAQDLTVDNINTTSINSGQPSGRRNKIINGGMDVSQRGTSFTGTGDEYTVDRFQHQVGSSFNGDTTTTQSTDHPSGFKNSLKITPDSTQTPSGSENLALSTQLEGFDVQDFAHGSSAPKSMTISFYAKSGSQNNNHVYSMQIRKYDASAGRKYVLKSFTVTTSWQRFSFTFTGDTATAIRNVNTVGIQIVWQLACGPDDLVSETSTWTSSTKFQGVSGQNNFMDNTSNEFFLTGVQLEIGSTATDFEHRSFGQELALCQRYFQKHTEGSGSPVCENATMYNSSTVFMSIPLPTTMRVAPSLLISNATNRFVKYENGGAVNFDTLGRDGITQPHLVCLNGSVSGQSRAACMIRGNNAATFVDFSAEL